MSVFTDKPQPEKVAPTHDADADTRFLKDYIRVSRSQGATLIHLARTPGGYAVAVVLPQHDTTPHAVAATVLGHQILLLSLAVRAEMEEKNTQRLLRLVASVALPGPDDNRRITDASDEYEVCTGYLIASRDIETGVWSAWAREEAQGGDSAGEGGASNV